MTRKFIQMGMTRAKRYANHRGGKKYDADGKEKAKLEHEGKAEKEEASGLFREVWQRCKAHEGYIEKRGDLSRTKKHGIWIKRTKNLRSRQTRQQGNRIERNGARKSRDNKQLTIILVLIIVLVLLIIILKR